jgi:hypothetical protein
LAHLLRTLDPPSQGAQGEELEAPRRQVMLNPGH